jgi:hypothetical protein
MAPGAPHSGFLKLQRNGPLRAYPTSCPETATALFSAIFLLAGTGLEDRSACYSMVPTGSLIDRKRVEI